MKVTVGLFPVVVDLDPTKFDFVTADEEELDAYLRQEIEDAVGEAELELEPDFCDYERLRLSYLRHVFAKYGSKGELSN